MSSINSVFNYKQLLLKPKFCQDRAFGYTN